MKKKILIGEGYKLNKKSISTKKYEKIYLNNSDRPGHLFCFGTTRIGKTRLIENMIAQDIEDGRSIVIVDPKGDIELLSKVVETAFKFNRQEELLYISPIYADYSAKIDPLAYYYMPEEIVSHIVSGIEVTGSEQFFFNVAYETTLSIVQSLLILQEVYPEEDNYYLNCSTIFKWCSHEDLKKLKVLLEEILKNETTNEKPKLKEKLDSAINLLNKQIQSPPDFFSKISTSLRTILTSLSTGNTGKIIGKAKSNEFIKRLENKQGIILIVQTGSLLTRQTSSIISKILVSMIQSFAGRKYAKGEKIEPAMILYLDEFSNIIYKDIPNLFNKIGGANVWINAFTQSIADLSAHVGEDMAREILDNTNTKIFMKVNDPSTATYISDFSGKKDKFSPIYQVGGSITVRELEVPLVAPENVTRLKTREFFYFGNSGIFKGKTTKVKPCKITIGYPELKSHN